MVHCASDTQTYSPLNSDEEAGFSGGSYDGTSSEDSEDENVRHTLGFKCIGAAHELPRQDF
ncbi:hypothetical protein OS493_029919 [Desmophyllum pertusum]|uniref:Uncharacterized protein n=1 Tax=Desmophyllum pertusum TaxID=174260 RepID=A0A9W9Y8W1_9CNID|nr:hypothetical protein OS493_029919 [Desmophyllum pertusum]